MAENSTDWLSVASSIGNKVLDTAGSAYVSKETAKINADRDLKALSYRAQADKTSVAPQGGMRFDLKSPVVWIIGGVIALVSIVFIAKS